MDRNTLLDLIPAYALGALDPDEQQEVETFLATDAEAQRLLAEYQAMTDALVLATPLRRAPAHLGDDMRRRLAATASAPQRSLPPVPQQAPVEPLQLVSTRRQRRILIPLLAAAAVLALVAGVLVILGRRNAADPSQIYAQIAALPDALHIPLTPVLADTIKGELVTTADGKQAIIQVWELPKIEDNQTYQLWLIDTSGAHSGGLMRFANTQGANYIVLPLDKPVKEYAAFGLSIEPAGGSKDPKGPSGPRAFGVTISS